jgi:hypothetical protein
MACDSERKEPSVSDGAQVEGDQAAASKASRVKDITRRELWAEPHANPASRKWDGVVGALASRSQDADLSTS